MAVLVDTAPMRLKADQAGDALSRPGAFVWMSGGQGAGREVVLESLQARFQDALAVVRLAPLSSPDAVAHVRLQLAVLAREGTPSLELLAGSTPEALATSLRRLEAHDRILVLRVHPSWEEGPGGGEQTLADRAWSFVRQLGAALKNEPLLRVLVLAGSPRWGALRDLGQRADQELTLAVPQLAARALEDEAAWRTLRDGFHRIRKGLGVAMPAPLQLRLGVALVSLGDSVSDVLRLLRSPVNQKHVLEPLTQRLRLLLAGHQHAPVLRRAALARFALPWEKLLAAVPELEDVEDLARLGLGYETSDGRVRLIEPVRRALLAHGSQTEGLLEAAELETHARFEEAWTQLDGAASPERLAPRRVIPWLEKMHHRAHAGGHSREQLEQLDLPAPEFYWDLGRALSREQGRFEDAAIVYRNCWRKFEHDDYAHHYYAWNLDRVAQKPEEVEQHYEKAIEQRPDNVWWHARLCTFLIHRARFRDAEEAFRQALMKVDPGEVEVRRDARLARSLHRWVVEAWLVQGEVERAREVLALVPAEVVSATDAFRALSARVADAVEAAELGESVYPPSIPPEDRWTPPAFVPDEEDGRERVTWRPGRVRRVDETGVELVCVESPEEPGARELQGREFSQAEWRAYARGKDARVDAFVIFAEYQGGLMRLYYWPTRSLGVRGPVVEEELDSLRYVRQWLGAAEDSLA